MLMAICAAAYGPPQPADSAEGVQQSGEPLNTGSSLQMQQWSEISTTKHQERQHHTVLNIHSAGRRFSAASATHSPRWNRPACSAR